MKGICSLAENRLTTQEGPYFLQLLSWLVSQLLSWLVSQLVGWLVSLFFVCLFVCQFLNSQEVKTAIRATRRYGRSHGTFRSLSTATLIQPSHHIFLTSKIIFTFPISSTCAIKSICPVTPFQLFSLWFTINLPMHVGALYLISCPLFPLSLG